MRLRLLCTFREGRTVINPSDPEPDPEPHPDPGESYLDGVSGHARLAQAAGSQQLLAGEPA